jgi:hypothetical protein
LFGRLPGFLNCLWAAEHYFTEVIPLSKVWVMCFAVAGLLFAQYRGDAATNEYYTSPKAKAVIDAMINALGGAEKMKAIDRVKIIAQTTSEGQTGRGTFYQTATKMRREYGAPYNWFEIYDGKEVVAIVNGKRAPAKPDSAKFFESELKEGVFQAALLDVFMNKDRHVIYRGKKTFERREYEVIETASHDNMLREHYIDPETHHEMVRIRHEPKGDRIVVVVAYDEFKGVFYQKRAVWKRRDGSVSGGMRVVEVSSDFDDSIFKAP